VDRRYPRKAIHDAGHKDFIPASQLLLPERGNIQSILSLAICKGPPSTDLAQVLGNYTWFLNLTSPSADLLKQMVETQNWGCHLGKQLQAAIRLGLAEAYCLTGALDEAQEQLEKARKFCIKKRLCFLAAQSLQQMAEIFIEQGDPKLKEAMDTLNTAKKEFASIRNHDARLQEMFCMIKLGECLYKDSQHEAAQGQLMQVIELLKTEFPKEHFYYSQALCHLAVAKSHLGDLESAISLSEEGLVKMKKLGSTWGQGWTLSVLGEILLKKGELGHSINVLEESIPLISSSGDHSAADHAQKLLGQAFHQQKTGFLTRSI